jgi:hypothetical protein
MAPLPPRGGGNGGEYPVNPFLYICPSPKRVSRQSPESHNIFFMNTPTKVEAKVATAQKSFRIERQNNFSMISTKPFVRDSRFVVMSARKSSV